MNILPIYTYDHPILRKKLKRVDEITDELVALAASMHHTMKIADGIGLAANQVGQDVAMTVIDISDLGDYSDLQPLTLVNPVVEAVSDESETFEEGCLSLPDLRADVVRPEAVQVRYFDLEMKEHVVEVDALLARVMQHEIDHLNGIYFFDHLKPIRRSLMKRKLLDIKRGEVEASYTLYAPNERLNDKSNDKSARA